MNAIDGDKEKKVFRTWRQKRIFDAAVRDYIRTGEPVASGVLAGKYRLGLSPASVRKVLRELEDLGLFERTHSTAGRTPTAKGFKVHADEVPRSARPPFPVRTRIKRELRREDFLPESLFTLCSKVLTDVTNHMGLVMAPALSSLGLRKLCFVKIGPGRFLSVMLTQNGTVQNKIFRTGEDFTREELNEVNVFLDERTVPFTLDELKEDILKDMGESRNEFERIFRRAYVLTSEVFQATLGAEDEAGDIYADDEGRTRLIANADPRDAEAMRGLFRAFENKKRLMDLLNEVTSGDRVRVVFGSDGEDPGGLALVASPYEAGRDVRGAVGVIGPRRLNYGEIVPVVDYAAKVLSEMFHG
ncbi:MAG: heat-inducible transcriptional repressor HrcA [Deltaproteobacteria bacterium]|jgi:heat-inducible transcriptional repressor|nr:heat-inducible transcriptional repressor HrcA [Deltaproteobacteria bacterium]